MLAARRITDYLGIGKGRMRPLLIRAAITGSTLAIVITP